MTKIRTTTITMRRNTPPAMPAAIGIQSAVLAATVGSFVVTLGEFGECVGGVAVVRKCVIHSTA